MVLRFGSLFGCVLIVVAAMNFAPQPIRAGEPVTLDNVVDPGANKADEPIAKKFSIEQAVHFLDSASLNWQKKRKCFTCHTNYAYLYARPTIAINQQAHQEVRKFAEKLVTERWPEKGLRWDAEAVATAAALAFNDEATTGQLHPVTKTALGKMWSVQRDDGGWTWIDCDWPPFEDDDHYGVTLAAIAVGVAPGDYKNSEEARKGVGGIRKYLKKNPPPELHNEAMLLWASSYLDGLLDKKEKQSVVDKLLSLQKPDGGWAAATLGGWKRGDDKKQDMKTSDGYGTGFTIFVLRRAGVPALDPNIRKGIDWLKTHQRESGRWYSRSLYKDSHHFLSHAGSAFAVMALAACDEIKVAKTDK